MMISGFHSSSYLRDITACPSRPSTRATLMAPACSNEPASGAQGKGVSMAAARRAARADQPFRRQHKNEHLGGRVRRHDALDRLGQEDAPAGRINKIAGLGRAKSGETGGKQQHGHRRAPALLSAGCGGRAKRHHPLNHAGSSVPDPQSQRWCGQTAHRARGEGSAARQHPKRVCRSAAPVDNRQSAAAVLEHRAMKIERIEAIPVEIPLNKVFSGSGYRVASRNTIITRIHTAGGLVSEVYNGDNRAHGRDIALIIQNELAPLLIGEDARHIERLWARMFQLSIPNRERKQVMEAIACVDTALWDLLGKSLGTSVATLLGGFRDRLPIIAIAAYYENGKTL